jgi:hypothetical protein
MPKSPNCVKHRRFEVYSNTLTRVEGKTRLSSEDPVAEVPRLKEQPGEPLGVGGATLMRP